ncbi:MAG: hypothetical protein AAFX99_26560, partial [Myxococcota bacterium]
LSLSLQQRALESGGRSNRAGQLCCTAPGKPPLDWSAHLTPGRAVTVTATARRSRLNHTRRLAETVFAAMASKIAVEQAEHPSTGQHVHVHLDHDTATVGVDMSGERLHRRGYRQETGRAPLRENMAAALLQWAQWSGIEPLIDPMCGSGTFLIEGALMAAGRAPGLGHTFPFEAWPVLNAQAWVRLVEEAQAAEQHPLEGLPPLQGSDRSAAAIALAQRNAARARCLEALQLTCRPVAELTPPQKGPGVVVCNPPYGKRIGSVKALVPMYQALGRSLKRFEGWRTVVLTTRKALYDTMMAELGQQPAEQLRFQHGGLTVFASCVWVGDDIQAHRTAEDKEPS